MCQLQHLEQVGPALRAGADIIVGQVLHSHLHMQRNSYLIWGHSWLLQTVPFQVHLNSDRSQHNAQRHWAASAYMSFSIGPGATQTSPGFRSQIHLFGAGQRGRGSWG